MAATQILEKAVVTTNVRNVRRLLKNSEHLERRELQGKPCLKREHELCRLQFAEKHVYATKRRRRAIFTDEKRFNLDRLDGLHCYYRDLRKEQQLPSRRRHGRRCNDLGEALVTKVRWKQNSLQGN